MTESQLEIFTGLNKEKQLHESIMQNDASMAVVSLFFLQGSSFRWMHAPGETIHLC